MCDTYYMCGQGGDDLILKIFSSCRSAVWNPTLLPTLLFTLPTLVSLTMAWLLNVLPTRLFNLGESILTFLMLNDDLL